jgi:hypothetical protein
VLHPRRSAQLYRSILGVQVLQIDEELITEFEQLNNPDENVDTLSGDTQNLFNEHHRIFASFLFFFSQLCVLSRYILC